MAELISRVREHVPGISIRYSAALDDGLAAAATDLRLDAVYLAMRLPTPRPGCALVGYVPDYQHRHLPHLFSNKELAERDVVFARLIGDSDAMVMNARAVAEDMRRFTPGSLPGLHVLPFSPNLDPEWLGDRHEAVAAYGITEPYFIVCNQFWMHKDHQTAFKALAEVIVHHPRVSLVCTGGITDYRNPSYFKKLETEAAKLGLGPHLRLLGHIPKRDQIELLKRSLALIQPTLFEGGPGGGSTNEAIALGQHVLLSDLPVNREITEGKVCFFPPGDHESLAKLMLAMLGGKTPRETDEALLLKNSARLHSYGLAVLDALRSAIDSRRQS